MTLKNGSFITMNDCKFVKARFWIALAAREGLCYLDLEFLKYESENEAIVMPHKIFPVIDEGEYCQVEVSPCGQFLAALES